MRACTMVHEPLWYPGGYIKLTYFCIRQREPPANQTWAQVYIYTSISISILYLKYQFQRSFCIIFLQITPHSYFKLICYTSIDSQTAARYGPDVRGPQLWSRHVMPACWLCRTSPLARRPIWLNQRKMLKTVKELRFEPMPWQKKCGEILSEAT
jgi:hypothetical protein